MLNFTWDQELALKVRAREVREDGSPQGLENDLVLSICNTTEKLGVPIERAWMCSRFLQQDVQNMRLWSRNSFSPRRHGRELSRMSHSDALRNKKL